MVFGEKYLTVIGYWPLAIGFSVVSTSTTHLKLVFEGVMSL